MSATDDFWLGLADPGAVALWDDPAEGPPLREFARTATTPDAALPTAKAVAEGDVPWAPGALAGVLGHHAPPADDAHPAFVTLVDTIHRAAAGTLDRSALLSAYGGLDGVELATPRDVANAVAAHPADMTDADRRRRFTEAAALVSGWLVCRSRHRGPAKAGIAVASLLEWPQIIGPAAELGRLTEFSAEVCMLLRGQGAAGQDALLELARWHRGWGRVHAVEALVAIESRRPEVDRWLVEEGWHNTVVDGYTAPLVAERVDVIEWMWVFDGSGTLQRAGLDGARGIALALLDPYSPGAGIDAFPVMEEVIDKWFLGLSMLPAGSTTIEDLGFAHTLWKDLENQNGMAANAFDDSVRADLGARCRGLLSEQGARETVAVALRPEAPGVAFGTAVELATAYGLDPVPALFARIEADPDDTYAWFHLCHGHGRRIGPEILSFALRVLPEGLVSETSKMPLSGPGPGPHAALMNLWGNLCRDDVELGPTLVHALLTSPAAPAREHGARLRENLSPAQHARLDQLLGAASPVPSGPGPTSETVAAPETAGSSAGHDGSAGGTGDDVVGRASDLLCWVGDHMGMTVLNAKPGDLVLTSSRLLFRSSSGKHDLDIPLASITECEAGKKRALVVRYREADGSPTARAFGKRMGMPDLAAWVAALRPR